MGDEPRRRYVRGSGGVRLAVAEWGDAAASTVVLVHGYPDTKELWSAVARRLAQRWHVVAYDVRGAGESGAPSNRAGYDLERLTDDFQAVIDLVSPVRPVHLVGHDWGSTQGWEFVTCARLAGRVASFTSVSGPSLDHIGLLLRRRASAPTAAAVGRALRQLTMSWYIGFFCLPVLPEWTWHHGLAARWPRILRDVDQVPDWDRPQPTLATDGANGVNLYRRNVPRRLRHPRVDSVARTPVQLVVATGDRFLSPDALDGVERWIPSLRRKTIVSSHWVPRTEPEALARWITEFATDVEAGRLEPRHGHA